MVNKEILEQIKESLKEVLSVLKDQYPIETIPLLHEQRITVTSSSVSIYSEQKLILSRFIREVEFAKLIDEGKLPTTKETILNLYSLPEFKTHSPVEKTRKELEGKMSGAAFGNTVGQFLNSFVTLKNDFDYDEEIFTEIWKEFEDIKIAENKAIVCAPLLGLKNKTTVQLTDGLFIEPMNEADYIRIYNNNKNASLSDIKYKLCKIFPYQGEADSIEAERKSLPARLAAIESIKKYIGAMRLASTGNFLADRIHYSHLPFNNRIVMFNGAGIYPLEIHASATIWNAYVFTNEAAERASAIYSKMTRGDLHSELRPVSTATEKFNQSYTRISKEDKILDFATILDSLLLYNSQQSNFFKLHLRCALLVRNKIGLNPYRLSDELLSCRNEIIHRSLTLEEYAKGKNYLTVDGTPMSLEEFVNNSEELARTVIVEYLNRIEVNQDVGTISVNLETELFRYLKTHPDFRRNVKI